MISPKHNAVALKARRRELRASLTPAEALLWRYLQRSQLAGRKFRRQHSIGPYIRAWRRDTARTTYLARAGVRVVRFENDDVTRNADGVLAVIAACFGER
jgi:very-short-patch-repair endonuclease